METSFQKCLLKVYREVTLLKGNHLGVLYYNFILAREAYGYKHLNFLDTKLRGITINITLSTIYRLYTIVFIYMHTDLPTAI